MSASVGGRETPGSSRPQPDPDPGVELCVELPAESRKTPLPPDNDYSLPDELLAGLTSTVCSGGTLGHTAHIHNDKGCGMRRPDGVWHHSLGQKKLKYFLEQPTIVTGASRDISFLRDALVTKRKTTHLPPLTDRGVTGDAGSLDISESLIPEEYHILESKGLQKLGLYDEAFTVLLQDNKQKRLAFPSLKPTGRWEVIQLMSLMDDMLQKAGVDQQREELTELLQMEGLLELVQVEQNIYNIVFHELIRQVSVGCRERGLLLTKLRERSLSLLQSITRHLKALHTEGVAQRAASRRLTEEIRRIKASLEQLSMQLSRVRDHDALVCQEVERAHQQLTGALDQTHTNVDIVNGYLELYEQERGRLEAQLLQMTEERDHWCQFCLVFKVIGAKELQILSQLHVTEQIWSNTAKRCSNHLTSKDTEDLNTIMELADYWKEKLTALLSQLKNTEDAQCEEITAIQQGITKWIAYSNTHNNCPGQQHDKASLETLHADLEKWANMLALQCEIYQGEKLLGCQMTLREVGLAKDSWMRLSLELFRRHPPPDGEAPVVQLTLRELDGVISELLEQLNTQISGESGIHGQIISLHGLIERWVSKLGTLIGRADTMSSSVCLKLEKALNNWKSLCEDALKNFTSLKSEDDEDKNKPNIYTQGKHALDKVQEFTTSLSSFTEGESQRLNEEVSSLHKAQTRWMLDMMLLMVPEPCEDLTQQQEHNNILNTSLQTLEEDAKMLAERLDRFTDYITSARKLILEEQIIQYLRKTDEDDEMRDCRKLKRVCREWLDTCMVLLSGVKGGPMQSPPSANREVKDEAEEEQEEGELTASKSLVIKVMGFDGRITQRKLGDSSVQLNRAKETVVCPVTDEAQKALSDLTTVGMLQQELRDSELRVQSAEQRALKAEEDLQAALVKNQDLKRQLQGYPSLEPESSDLTTVGILQQELRDSELRVQSTEQRALKAEEALQASLEKIGDLERQLQGFPLQVQSAEQRALKAEQDLQAALEKIQDLERQLQGYPGLEPESSGEKKESTPLKPPPAPVRKPAPPKKTTPESKPAGSSKKTKRL